MSPGAPVGAEITPGDANYDAPPVEITTTSLPGSTVATAYSQTIVATGGTAPYTFAVTAGSLPDGLSLAGNGALTGTPTVAGTFNFTVTATDDALATDPQDYTVIIVAATTTTTLVANPLATTGGSLVMLTATVGPSPGVAGSVTFFDGGVAIPGASDVPVSGGVAVFSTNAFSVGSHSLTAVYNGSANYLASLPSNTQTVEISNSGTPPSVAGFAVNVNEPGFAGAQRSRVVNLQVAFDQPVQVDANAFALALHANNLGLGDLPSTLLPVTTDGGTTWVIEFSGNTDAGADGFESIKDGVYDLNVNLALVHPLGVPGVNGSGTSTFVFHRLFGDVTGEELPQLGNAHVAVIAIDDNFAFRSSFNSVLGYKAYFDFDGDNNIGISDNFQFRSRFNRPLTWNA